MLHDDARMGHAGNALTMWDGNIPELAQR